MQRNSSRREYRRSTMLGGREPWADRWTRRAASVAGVPRAHWTHATPLDRSWATEDRISTPRCSPGRSCPWRRLIGRSGGGLFVAASKGPVRPGGPIGRNDITKRHPGSRYLTRRGAGGNASSRGCEQAQVLRQGRACPPCSHRSRPPPRKGPFLKVLQLRMSSAGVPGCRRSRRCRSSSASSGNGPGTRLPRRRYPVRP